MRVIARNSTSKFKGSGHSIDEISNALDVRYIVQGSIRVGGNRVRISAHLVDSRDGAHIWAERYDRVIDDIFDIQDEITKEIVTALRVQLTDGELASVLNRETNCVDAWRLCVEATEQISKYDVPSARRARELAQRALASDPNYAHALAVIGFSYWCEARQGLELDNTGFYETAYDFGRRAIEINENSPWGYAAMGLSAAGLGRLDEGVRIIEDGLSRNPNTSELLLGYAVAVMKRGDFAEAAAAVESAMHRNPYSPGSYYSVLSRAHEGRGQLEQALEICDEGLKRHPNFFALLMSKASLLARTGNVGEAEKTLARFRDIAPHFRMRHIRKYLFIDDEGYCRQYMEGLRSAGLPE